MILSNAEAIQDAQADSLASIAESLERIADDNAEFHRHQIESTTCQVKAVKASEDLAAAFLGSSVVMEKEKFEAIVSAARAFHGLGDSDAMKAALAAVGVEL